MAGILASLFGALLADRIHATQNDAGLHGYRYNNHQYQGRDVILHFANGGKVLSIYVGYTENQDSFEVEFASPVKFCLASSFEDMGESYAVVAELQAYLKAVIHDVLKGRLS